MMADLNAFYIVLLILPVGFLGVLIVIRAKNKSLEETSPYFFLLWNFLLGLLILSTSFAAAETYYRFFVDTTDSFGINKITQRWGKRHFQGNNFQFRDNIDYTYKIGTGKKRITFIGDSFTAGHGVVNVEDRFGNLLRSQFPHYEIHILSGNGLETNTELQLLQDMLAKGYETDQIVWVYNLNDIAYLLPETQALFARILQYNEELNYFQKESYFLNTMSFRLHAANNPDFQQYFGYVAGAYFSQPWLQQQSQLDAAVQLCQSHAISFSAVTFPFLHSLPSGYQFKEVHQQLDIFWRSRQIAHLDLLPLYQAHAAENLVVNRYDAHPNENAHALAAQAIGPFLQHAMQ